VIPTWLISAAAAALLVGCSASGDRVASAGHPGAGGAGALGSGGSGSLVLTDGGRLPPIGVPVEQDRLRVEIVTVRCAGQCTEVEAVAKGGKAPYTFVWENGSTNPVRTLCPTEALSFAVTAKDAGVSTGEFRRDPQVATATVTAQVLACGARDAGVSPRDAGPPPREAAPPGEVLCLSNLSFEGRPSFNYDGPEFDAAPWVVCPNGTPDIVDGTLFLGENPIRAFHGNTYLRMLEVPTNFSVNEPPMTTEPVSQQLCAPLEAGVTRHLRMHIARSALFGPASLQIWGAAESCGTAELLASSPDATPSWTSYCATLRPTRRTTHLTLAPQVDVALINGAPIYVDHLELVDSCP
jgi:hypothetical protein